MVDPGLAGAGTPAPAGDPFSGASTVYAQYGYAGLHWSTYDLGCLGSAGDPSASVDTMVGNWLLGLAVFVVSASNGLHTAITEPDWLAPLDGAVTSVTAAVRDALWTPWGPVGLLLVVCLLLVTSMRGQLADTVKGAAWALLVITVLAGVVNYPLRAAQAYDRAVIGTLQDLDVSLASVGGAGTSVQDGREAHAALLVDRVLYQAWLRGHVGATTGTGATTWGPQLFRAQALTYSEVAAASDPARRAQLVTAKAAAWKATTQQIQTADPGVYTAVQGRAGGRTSSGAMALFAALTTAAFRILADLFLAAGLVMLRLVVMVFPAAAVLGVLVTFSGPIRRLGNAAGASVINVIAFGTASALHTTIVTAALGSTGTGGGLTWMAMVLCLMVEILLFVFCRPLMSVTSLAGTTPRRRAGALRAVGRWTTNALRRSTPTVGSERQQPTPGGRGTDRRAARDGERGPLPRQRPGTVREDARPVTDPEPVPVDDTGHAGGHADSQAGGHAGEAPWVPPRRTRVDGGAGGDGERAPLLVDDSGTLLEGTVVHHQGRPVTTSDTSPGPQGGAGGGMDGGWDAANLVSEPDGQPQLLLWDPRQRRHITEPPPTPPAARVAAGARS